MSSSKLIATVTKCGDRIHHEKKHKHRSKEPLPLKVGEVKVQDNRKKVTQSDKSTMKDVKVQDYRKKSTQTDKSMMNEVKVQDNCKKSTQNDKSMMNEVKVQDNCKKSTQNDKSVVKCKNHLRPIDLKNTQNELAVPTASTSTAKNELRLTLTMADVINAEIIQPLLRKMRKLQYRYVEEANSLMVDVSKLQSKRFIIEKPKEDTRCNAIGNEKFRLSVHDIIELKIVQPILRKMHDIQMRNAKEHLALMEQIRCVPQNMAEVYKSVYSMY